MKPAVAAWLAGGTVLAALLGALGWGVFHPAPQPQSSLVGQVAPDLTIRPLGGGEIALSSLRGRPVVVNFWASWCVSCRQEEAALSQAARTHEGKVSFLGVDIQDSDSAARAYEAEARRPYPVGPASSGSYLDFGVRAPPETFFIDSRGHVAGRLLGPVDGAVIAHYLEQMQ